MFIPTILFGCDFIEYDDISSEEQSAPFINTKYKSQKELLVYGITLDRNYKQVIDYYTIMEPPGIGGPEVVSKDILPKDTVVKILRVERCNNCFPFPAHKRLVVKILSSSKFSSSLVEIESNRINIKKTDAFVRLEQTHNKSLNLTGAKNAPPS